MANNNYSDNFFIQVRPLDIARYGVYTALILGYLNTISCYYGDGEKVKFYHSMKSIAETIGISQDTMTKHCPTEEMGWKHFSAYKPGTLIKTTWWEPVNPAEIKEVRTERTSADVRTERTSNININNNINRMSASADSHFPSPSGTPLFSSSKPAPTEAGGQLTNDPFDGVVKEPTVDVKKKSDSERKHNFALQDDLLKLMGIRDKVKPGVKFGSAIKGRLAQGYTDSDLRLVARLARGYKASDPIYANPIFVFSEAGVSQLMTKKDKTKMTKADWNDTALIDQINWKDV